MGESTQKVEAIRDRFETFSRDAYNPSHSLWWQDVHELLREIDRFRAAFTQIIEDEVGGRCPMWWTLPELGVEHDGEWIRQAASEVLDAILRVAYEALDRPLPEALAEVSDA